MSKARTEPEARVLYKSDNPVEIGIHGAYAVRGFGGLPIVASRLWPAGPKADTVSRRQLPTGARTPRSAVLQLLNYQIGHRGWLRR